MIVNQNFNGVTDYNEFTEKLESALNRKGIARNNKRNRFFSRGNRQFDGQGG